MPTDRARPRRRALPLLAALAVTALSGTARAQDIEPRRWSHMPTGLDVVGATLGYTSGTLEFDPVLEVQDATMQVSSLIAAWTHSFAVAGKTGRIDMIVPYQQAEWEGLVQGAPTTVKREGLADPWVRFSVGLVGAPALKGAAYQQYRKARPVNTVVGVGLGIGLPLGQYDPTKLLNLGNNRFAFRPQAGVVHTRGPWSYELTGSAYLFTDNTDFFNGNERDQAPIYAAQGHVIRSFRNTSWLSASLAYGVGGESTINGESKDDDRSDLLWAFSGGIPIGKTQGLKLTYLRYDNRDTTSVDTQSVLLSWNMRF